MHGRSQSVHITAIECGHPMAMVTWLVVVACLAINLPFPINNSVDVRSLGASRYEFDQ